ncbi:uncharacterized protein LOC112569167 [Pomacea canaliculata]|uniref:uncharacterized protein LOC112569167 n=1 Tax=Pomacea canaliculata TaxID=400727 RepID=UPI000D73CCE0|nr:uncharacterized protein LOC112569167 [Pomacea canaliculata]
MSVRDCCICKMAARVCRHFLLSRLSLAVVVMVVTHRQVTEGAALTEGVITDAHQVACQRSADGLVLLTLQDARNTSRTVVANRLRKSCVGTLTFYACLINEVVIEVKAVITDLQEGELRTFTCLASMEGETGTETKVLGQVNVTKTGPAANTTSAATESLDRLFEKFMKSSEQCSGGPTAGFAILIVVIVIFGIISIILIVLYLRELIWTVRSITASVTAPSLETNGAKVQKVESTLKYPLLRLPHCVTPSTPTTGAT